MYIVVIYIVVFFLKLFYFMLGYIGGFINIYKKDLLFIGLGILFFQIFFLIQIQLCFFYNLYVLYINKVVSLRKLVLCNIVVFMKFSMLVFDGVVNK